MNRKTTDPLIDQHFDVPHAAGITRYRVDRKSRTIGFYECVAIKAVTGSHHFIGSIQTFSRTTIAAHLEAVS